MQEKAKEGCLLGYNEYRYGVTSINTAREEQPQCVICFQVLSNCYEALKSKIVFPITQTTHKKTEHF